MGEKTQFLVSLKSLKKGVWSGSGSFSQRYGSPTLLIVLFCRPAAEWSGDGPGGVGRGCAAAQVLRRQERTQALRAACQVSASTFHLNPSIQNIRIRKIMLFGSGIGSIVYGMFMKFWIWKRYIRYWFLHTDSSVRLTAQDLQSPIYVGVCIFPFAIVLAFCFCI